MDVSSLRRINLNLLIVFEVLSSVRNATRAAKLLNMTQPGVSRKLAELRHIFGDPLFVSNGRNFELTERALGLREPIREALTSMRFAIEESQAFDPGASMRTFRIACSNMIEWVLAPALIGQCAADAPGVKIMFNPPFNPAPTALELDNQGIDLVIDVEIDHARDDAEKIVRVPLSSDLRSCVVRHGHPLGAGPISLQQFSELSFVTLSSYESRQNNMDRWLLQHGLRRKFGSYLSNISIAPFVVMQTDYALALPLQLARFIAQFFPLDVVQFDFSPPPVKYNMSWHRRWNASQAHAWLRQSVRKLMFDIPLGTVNRTLER